MQDGSALAVQRCHSLLITPPAVSARRDPSVRLGLRCLGCALLVVTVAKTRWWLLVICALLGTFVHLARAARLRQKGFAQSGCTAQMEVQVQHFAILGLLLRRLEVRLAQFAPMVHFVSQRDLRQFPACVETGTFARLITIRLHRVASSARSCRIAH